MTSRLVRASDLTGQPVVAIDSGEDVAEIRDIIFDGLNHELIGFTLNKRGWFRGTLREDLPAESIAAIGPDAVMVLSETELQAPEVSPAALTGDVKTHQVIGTNVVGGDGTDLGEVVGVIVTTEGDPQAVGYELSPDGRDSVFVPISAELALSGDHMMLPAEATEFVRNDLAGFGAAIGDYRSRLNSATSTPNQEPETVLP